MRRFLERQRLFFLEFEVAVDQVIGEDVARERSIAFEDRGVRLLRLPTVGGIFDWNDLGGSLAGMGILHVLAEGGAKTAAWLIKKGAAKRLELFQAPTILGATGLPVIGDLGVTCLSEATLLSIRRIRRIGEDVQITLDVK